MTYKDLHLKLLLRIFWGCHWTFNRQKTLSLVFYRPHKAYLAVFLNYFSSSIISGSRYDMLAKQKQLEYQVNTLGQLHETGLKY